MTNLLTHMRQKVVMGLLAVLIGVFLSLLRNDTALDQQLSMVFGSTPAFGCAPIPFCNAAQFCFAC